MAEQTWNSNLRLYGSKAKKMEKKLASSPKSLMLE